jgi:ABC-type nitrate/sulfonate/bicarbonate transport system permease component
MKLRGFLYAAGGTLLLACAWEVIGRNGTLGTTLPAPSQVLGIYADAPRRALLLRSAAATLKSAGIGYAIGICLGAATALIAHLVPVLRGGLDRLAVLVNALPVIALAPVLIITAGRQDTPALLASIPVFFLMYTSTGVGLRGVSQRLGQIFSTLGANRWQRLAKLEAVAAVPSVLSGMKIAASGAMIGTVVGEWFGAPAGLGVVVINSMQNYQIPLLWATVMVIAVMTLGAYGVLTVAEQVARRGIGQCDA